MVNKIIFADLTHTYQSIATPSFPYGISLVASNLLKDYKGHSDVEIIKYPEELNESLKKSFPKVACFSNYSWNLDLGYESAKVIKKYSPETIIIFGGPNFPIELEKQKEFLDRRKEIDFYIRGEGEVALPEIYRILEENNFEVNKIKDSGLKIGNTSYLSGNEIVDGGLISRLTDLDTIPSPYLTGLLDKYFEGRLIPIIQSTRGCPFKCTYCQEGSDYCDSITRFSNDRIKEELEYIGKRTKVQNLILADSNFGMYKNDLETCKNFAEVKKVYNWPKYIETSFGKNKKLVFEAVSMLEGGILLSAPVQSTNPIVLENIRRKNISMERIIELAKSSASKEANSLSEVILGLPGDTVEAHYKSVLDMIDSNINVVRSHQLLMLPASEMSNSTSRDKYKINTKFRLEPICFGNYNLLSEIFSAAEIDELCIENSTMSHQDYLKCRCFDLSVELFYNNGIFKELTNFLNLNDIKTSTFVMNSINNSGISSFNEIYSGFLKETENSLWSSFDELERHIKTPGMIEEYVSKNLRNNEQLGYRAAAFFNQMEDLHNIAFLVGKDLLSNKGALNSQSESYLNQLKEFSLLRKNNLLDLEVLIEKEFNYDFNSLLNQRFNVNPMLPEFKKDVKIQFFHTSEQKTLISDYLKQFGRSINGLGYILSRSNTNKIYRMTKSID